MLPFRSNYGPFLVTRILSNIVRQNRFQVCNTSHPEIFENHNVVFLIKLRFELKAGSLIAKLKVLDPAFAQDAERSSPFISVIAVAFPMLIPEDRLDNLDDQWRSFGLETPLSMPMSVYHSFGMLCGTSKMASTCQSTSCCPAL